MTIVGNLYLDLVLAGFSVFFVTLMAVWIWTRGWEPRPAQVAEKAEPEAEAAPLRKAA